MLGTPIRDIGTADRFQIDRHQTRSREIISCVVKALGQ
jgi:hypothetical protein